MKKRSITLLFLVLFARIFCNGQAMDFERNLEILDADYGTCYTIGNYMICPDKEVIRVGQMFGTATKDCFGYFPNSTLQYKQVTMVIFAGEVFFDDPEMKIDWANVKLLSHRQYYSEFTDGDTLYYLDNSRVSTRRGIYDINTYKPDIENRLKYRKEDELSEGFCVKNNTFYFHNKPILESFDVPNLHTIISKSGFETNYITDGKQVVFGGGKGGYSSTRKNGKEYVVAERWMIDGVDLPSLRVLGRDLLADKNALYYCENRIPFDKLNGFKLLIREM